MLDSATPFDQALLQRIREDAAAARCGHGRFSQSFSNRRRYHMASEFANPQAMCPRPGAFICFGAQPRATFLLLQGGNSTERGVPRKLSPWTISAESTAEKLGSGDPLRGRANRCSGRLCPRVCRTGSPGSPDGKVPPLPDSTPVSRTQ